MQRLHITMQSRQSAVFGLKTPDPPAMPVPFTGLSITNLSKTHNLFVVSSSLTFSRNDLLAEDSDLSNEGRKELAVGGVTGRMPKKPRRPKRGLAKEMPGRAEAYSPAANLALLANAVQSGVLPRDLFAAFEAVEWGLHQVALALCVCQPRNAAGAFSVRWWRTDGQKSWLRRPVLVRLVMHGGAVVPRKVVGRMPKVRLDGTFSTNADLMPPLLGEYRALYGQWLVLRDLVARCMAFDRGMRRSLAKADQAVAHQAGLVPALMRAGRGRAEAAGYDMGWVDRLRDDAEAEAASLTNAVNG